MGDRPIRGNNRASPRHEAEIGALHESIRASGSTGKPLNLTSMPFKQSGDAVVGGMFGPPGWAVRLKQIHDLRVQLEATLEAAWADHARRWRNHPQEFTRRWEAYLVKLDVAKLNTLIRKHNEWYPIEARLPIVYPTGEYHIPSGVEYPQKLVTAEVLIELYPSDLDMALYFTGQDNRA
jgi:hypothetical protein